MKELKKHWFVEAEGVRLSTTIYGQFLCIVALVELDGVEYEHGSFWA